jgi:4-diphosphocytidyl-2-C-methyl-D-erythritol kinase
MSGTHVEARAFAKLNLSLDVLGLMDDGYHAVRMVMQTVGLCDNIAIKLNDSGLVRAHSNLHYLPCDRRNIAVKAVELFFAETGMQGRGAEVHLKKRIPVCAGLGGGSSDAAAILRALNTVTGAGLTRSELETLGARLGSDVPFCIAGGTALAEGRGEVLRDLPPLPRCDVVICKPRFSISTPELFSKIDSRASRCRPDTDGILAALGARDLQGVAVRMYNVFEDVLPPQFSAIYEIKRCLLDSGAIGAAMSGTGSAVFGLFEDRTAASTAYAKLHKCYRDCFLTETTARLSL